MNGALLEKKNIYSSSTFSLLLPKRISHVSGCAMICGNRKQTDSTIIIGLCLLCTIVSEKTSGYKYRVAPDTAITGNGDNDTPVQSQPRERGITQ
ncbi:MAG: hypothetical protein ACOX8Q_05480 [Christensenellales bacterium]